MSTLTQSCLTKYRHLEHSTPGGLTRISKSYLLLYPDGSRKHVNRSKRDELLLSGLARQTGPQRNLFTGQMKTFHTFADWAKTCLPTEQESKRHFLPGTFVFEHDGLRRREMLETPGRLAYRLKLYPGQVRT